MNFTYENFKATVKKWDVPRTVHKSTYFFLDLMYNYYFSKTQNDIRQNYE